MSGELLEIYTDFEGFETFAGGFADRVEFGRVILYGPEGFETSTPVSFAIYLADGSAALAGIGQVAGCVDGGSDRDPTARFDIVLDEVVPHEGYEEHWSVLYQYLGLDGGAAVAEAYDASEEAGELTVQADISGESFAEPLGEAVQEAVPQAALGGLTSIADESSESMDESGLVRAVFTDGESLDGEAGLAAVIDAPRVDAPADISVAQTAMLDEVAPALEGVDDEDFEAPELSAVTLREGDEGYEAPVEVEAAEAFADDEPLPEAESVAEAPAVDAEEIGLDEAQVDAPVVAFDEGLPLVAAEDVPEEGSGWLRRPVLQQALQLSAEPVPDPTPPGPFFEYAPGSLPQEALPPRPEGYETVQLSLAPHPAHAAEAQEVTAHEIELPAEEVAWSDAPPEEITGFDEESAREAEAQRDSMAPAY